MAANNIKPWGIGAGANVITQAQYEALTALATGFVAGKASSAQINKVLRQASFIAAALAQVVSDKMNSDVLDNGDLPALVTLMKSALTPAASTIQIAGGGTGATTAAAARTNLGLGSVATESTVPVNKGGTGAATAAAARTNLGLGALAEIDTASVARGGTGATTAAAARTNLGVYSTGEVYSRTDSDARYNRLNTGFFAPTNGRHQDASTGLMIQVGRVTRSADLNNVTFPQAFPNACIGVVMTKNESTDGDNSKSNISAIIQSVNGFTAVMYAQERGATWLAIGY
ncbi:hypothetical protein AAFN90_00920 [Erwiniaceae bacterium CAU 1747]